MTVLPPVEYWKNMRIMALLTESYSDCKELLFGDVVYCCGIPLVKKSRLLLSGAVAEIAVHL